jgi:hypothetical protein
VQQVHETWAPKLYTRDRDITPGEVGPVRPVTSTVLCVFACVDLLIIHHKHTRFMIATQPWSLHQQQHGKLHSPQADANAGQLRCGDSCTFAATLCRPLRRAHARPLCHLSCPAPSLHAPTPFVVGIPAFVLCIGSCSLTPHHLIITKPTCVLCAMRVDVVMYATSLVPGVWICQE